MRGEQFELSLRGFSGPTCMDYGAARESEGARVFAGCGVRGRSVLESTDVVAGVDTTPTSEDVRSARPRAEVAARDGSRDVR